MGGNHHGLILVFLISTPFLLQSVECSLENESNSTDANSILHWEPPAELRKWLPYYLSGFDKEGYPVFIFEGGRWDIRGFLESQIPEVKYYDKYMHQLSVRVTSPELVVSDNHTESREAQDDGNVYTPQREKFILIADMDGYSLRQAAYGPSLQKYLYTIRTFVGELKKKRNIKKGFFINSNFVFQSVWNLMKPIFGETINFMELYGTQTNKWKPVLLEYIDKDQLPRFLGGTRDDKLLRAFG